MRSAGSQGVEVNDSVTHMQIFVIVYRVWLLMLKPHPSLSEEKVDTSTTTMRKKQRPRLHSTVVDIIVARTAPTVRSR